MKYYWLKDDINYSGRWFLNKISGLDNWSLYSKVPELTEHLSVLVSRHGNEMDFTLTSSHAVPIVSDRLKAALSNFSGIKFIPVTLNGYLNEYFVMIIDDMVDCVDEVRSKYQKFEVNDPVRPDRAGSFRAFFSMVIDADKVIGIDILRVKRFEMAIIVSDNVKIALENSGVTGVELSFVGC